MEKMNESLSLLNEQVAEMQTEIDDYKDIKESLNHAHSNIAHVQIDVYVALLRDKLKENESNCIMTLEEKVLNLMAYWRMNMNPG